MSALRLHFGLAKFAVAASHGATVIRAPAEAVRAGTAGLLTMLQGQHPTLTSACWPTVASARCCSPVSHVKWLAERIPNATVVVQVGDAHFGPRRSRYAEPVKWRRFLLDNSGNRGVGIWDHKIVDS
jgi:hypothetical protein